MSNFMRTAALFFSVLGVAACAAVPPAGPVKPTFLAASFSDLPGWTADDLSGLRAALVRTCDKRQSVAPDKPLLPAGTVSDWAPFCAQVATLSPSDIGTLRRVIEETLVPWQITAAGTREGLFTGYYEASLKGSATRHGAYQTPIRARPADHIVVDLGLFKPEWKGQRITGQLLSDQTLRPYPDRAEITRSGASAADRVIAWVDDPVDAFFLEVQGSGRIDMDDGSVLQVGYAERNGHAYQAIGKVLVQRGEMTKDQVSMQSIRAWLSAHPDQARAAMNTNPSYIFFRKLTGEGPLGGEGVALTPLRSLAVDRTLWSYGLPFYVDAAPPSAGAAPVQRLMVGQDTGGAIRGPVRGDVFWGYGPAATQAAGVMKSPGQMWILLPRGVDPSKPAPQES